MYDHNVISIMIISARSGDRMMVYGEPCYQQVLAVPLASLNSPHAFSVPSYLIVRTLAEESVTFDAFPSPDS